MPIVAAQPVLSFRPLAAADQDRLWHWLHIALWDPPPAGLRPIEALQQPGVRIYAEQWGIWSAVNIAKYEQLLAQGRITLAGARAFAARRAERSVVYAYEQRDAAALAAEELRAFRRRPAAWRFFEAAPPSYRKMMLHWVTSAKRAETRAARLSKLIDACADGLRL